MPVHRAGSESELVRRSIINAAAGKISERLVLIERCRRDDIDRTADGIGVIIRRNGFNNLDGSDEVRGDSVKRDAPSFCLRDADDITVDGHLIQVGINATNDDIARFALIDFDRDSR